MAKQTMPRPQGRMVRRGPVRGALRRDAVADPPDGAPVSRKRSKGQGPADLRRLAAEVERLEDEVAGMREKLRELEARADIDALTDVFNRRGFDRELTRAVSYVARYGGSAALVYLDLDGFKQVNDRYGHAAGDAVLKAVAAALTNRVRASDTVARLGGDEFALLLWNLDERNASAKASGLEAAIDAMRVPFEGAQLSVGASAGVAMLAAGLEAAELMSRADTTMYARKRERRNDR